MVSCRSMRISPSAGRIDVDDGFGEVRHVAQKLRLGHLGDLVCPGDGQSSIDAEPYLGQESVSGPSRPNLRDRHHTVHCSNDFRDSLDYGRVHGVKKALPDAADSLVANHHYCDGDDQTHGRVCPLCT